MLRDSSELRQPLAKEAMAVLAAVYVSVTDNVRFIVRDRQMTVNSIVFVDVIVYRVIIRAENHCLISSVGDLLIYVLEILPNQELNSSVAPTDECLARSFLSLF